MDTPSTKLVPSGSRTTSCAGSNPKVKAAAAGRRVASETEIWISVVMPRRGGVGSGRCTLSPYRTEEVLRVRPAIMRSPTTAASRGSRIRSKPPTRSESTTFAGPLSASVALAAARAARSKSRVRRADSFAAASPAVASSPAALSSVAIARRVAAMSSSVGWRIVGTGVCPTVALIPVASTRSTTAVASETQLFQAARSTVRVEPDGNGGRPSALSTKPASVATTPSPGCESAFVVAAVSGNSMARWEASGSRERSRIMRSWSGIRADKAPSALMLASN